MKLSHQFTTDNTIQREKPTGRSFKINNLGDIVNLSGDELTQE